MEIKRIWAMPNKDTFSIKEEQSGNCHFEIHVPYIRCTKCDNTQYNS